MAISMGSAGEGEPMGDMNTTPLIDVMLVLLIMFIVTIPIQTHAVKLDLPPPNPNPQNIDPVFNQINIDFLNTIYWNDQEVTMEQLETYLRQVGAMPTDQQPELRLRPDAMARYEVVDAVMAKAQQAGIKKMGFVGNEAYANL
ncbi:MAG: biopolymer transporter ExbD [Sphingomonadaceae bacterium]|uniref:ExbD/TolR family protein n=1 Tax=Thermaurantiacus sp. TaxID=2820283 RepID=UPI00298F346F|nr:biopolymer transporter ExbD [Thermaurantiacus sp.]MCS6986794.1 biopolymer transporter ExbD [Sphingomonadaceae bacterium]MDW8413943.1 biopolymer transporter ExbD [Thermaurantiacus sp.]